MKGPIKELRVATIRAARWVWRVVSICISEDRRFEGVEQREIATWNVELMNGQRENLIGISILVIVYVFFGLKLYNLWKFERK